MKSWRYIGLRRWNRSSRVISGGFGIYKNVWHWNHAKKGYREPTRHQGAPLCMIPMPKIIYIQKPPKVNLDEFLRRRKPLYLHNLIYSPFPAPCRRGESITGGHLHHSDGLHDEEGVVHPRGWWFVPVAMCLISLSLSLSLVFLIWHDLHVSQALLI